MTKVHSNCQVWLKYSRRNIRRTIWKSEDGKLYIKQYDKLYEVVWNTFYFETVEYI